MHAQSLLLALLASTATANRLQPRQSGITAVPSAPPSAPPAPSAAPSAAPTETTEEPEESTSSTRSVDLRACQTALDTLILSIGLIPTPNAAFSAYLATETVTVHDPCSWIADAPGALAGPMSAYSTDVVSLVSANEQHVSRVLDCLDAKGTSITRAETVTPLFGMTACAAVSVTSSGASGVTKTASSTSRTPTFPTPTSTSTSGARETGAVVGAVAVGVLFGVAGAM
ncbi:hypothetical protein B0H67DRAFT_556743 [Lasiosphaeris hirsuta]|uniref:Infection structure specific protein n=1 Tax=Lasiosphaeris hirsuta TaxID=260670 RepID=A0AA40DM35_9PEZI|nr:hypothetical protein B0H67DRAFT_556743 [Lasiosphaeris hirsuta]